MGAVSKIARAVGALSSRKLTLKQKANFARACLHYVRKSVHVSAYPVKLTIDPCNYCNLHCALCPVGQGEKGRQRSMMSFELFRKVIDECEPYLWQIDLFNWGEPLLNKNVFQMVSYARARHIDVALSSNMNHLPDDMCREMVESDLNRLICSVDGASQQTVEKYQKGGSFGTAIENMKKVLAVRRELGRKRPIVQWRFLVNRFNEGEVEQARQMAQAIGVDDFELGFFRCDMGRELLMDNDAQYNSVLEWLPENEAYSLYDYSDHAKKLLRQTCRFLWLESVIHPNGAVAPCCAVWPERFDFGNVEEQSFMDIWNGEGYVTARRIVRGDDVEAAGNVCAACKKNRAFV